jgi:hypothetical protein
MLMENTAWQALGPEDDGTSVGNSRFYLVVVQCVLFLKPTLPSFLASSTVLAFIHL